MFFCIIHIPPSLDICLTTSTNVFGRLFDSKYIYSLQTYVLHYVLCICMCICLCVLCDFDVCTRTYRFNEFASFCRRLIKIHSEKTVALPPKPKPNSNLTCKTESTRVLVYVCVCVRVCWVSERERDRERAYATESTKRSRGRVEPLNKRGNKHKSESEESLRPI